jgi:uncharacterized protein (TIGR02145 family)
MKKFSNLQSWILSAFQASRMTTPNESSKSNTLRLSFWSRSLRLSSWKFKSSRSRLLPLAPDLFRGIGSIALFLAACGDEVTTQVIQDNVSIVSTSKELPKCTEDNEGEQAFVKGEKSKRICVNGKWEPMTSSGKDTVVVKDTVVIEKNSTCTTKELNDKSGVKIVCGGDSVGVVLNGKQGEKGDKGDAGVAGKDGSNGKDGANGKDGSDCTVATLADKSGLKVICGGDSVGVVLNGANGEAGAAGKDGSNGKDGTNGKDGVDCSVASKTDSTVTIACGTDKFTMSLGGGSAVKPDTGDVVYEIENASISGVSQKGPFVMGTTVTTFELDGSKSLLQTGRAFVGDITQDDGRFNMSNVTLKSSYVRLSANGYYRNEVTGKNSTSPITLNAVTDLDSRNTVNVNLLTHLEYDRVAHLMAQGDGTLKIKNLKKQAEGEIFKAFHFDDLVDFGYSEDLDVFGKTDADAALLAISILLQGDRNEAGLTALLSGLSSDFKDGTWDSAQVKAEIADSALSKDVQNLLPKYRANMKDWGLSTTVPEFEKYIRRYASVENGLGVCGSDSTPVGTVKQVKNVNSKKYYAATYTAQNNKTRFICTDSTGVGKMWRIAEPIEKDTATWGAVNNGEVRTGQVNTDIYYIYETSNNAWRNATTLEYDTYKQKCLTDGTIVAGNIVSTNKYVCDNGKFREAEPIEINGGKGCTSYNRDSLRILDKDADGTKQYSFYRCTADGWTFTLDSLIRGTVIYAGQTYKTIAIKTQMWMAENLNYEVENSYCYENSADSCAKYGRLYTWAAAMDSAGVYSENSKGCGYDIRCSVKTPARGICPEGWHIPTSAEWQTLYSAIGGSFYGMQAKGFDYWSSATDAYGFSALPAGFYHYICHMNRCDYFYDDGGSIAYFWSATQNNSYDGNFRAVNWYLSASQAGLFGYGIHDGKDFGLSVRCVKD